MLLLSLSSMAQHCLLSSSSKNGELSKTYSYNAQGVETTAQSYKHNQAESLIRYTTNPQGWRLKVEKLNPSHQLESTEEYSYAQNKISRIQETENGVITHSYTFSYNAQGQLSQRDGTTISKKGKKKVTRIVYEWQLNNIVKQTEYRLEDGQYDLRQTTIYTYDKSANPYFGRGAQVKNLSANNIVSKTTYDRFQQTDLTESYTATLEYNAQNYPIRYTKLFASGKQSVRTFEYQCN